METEVLIVDPRSPEPARIARAAELIRQGQVVAFPTETVYGLGASAFDPQAVAKIFIAKGRPSNNPLIVHLASIAEVVQVAATFPAMAQRLAEGFWPGPLTLVLPSNQTVASAVTAGGNTVAVRVPAHPVAQSLLRAAGVPIAAPSANRSMQLSPTQAGHVARGLGGRIPMILDAGPTAGGIESTVLDVTRDPPRLLRPGLISVAQLESLVGRLAPAAVELPASGPQLSPGMSSRHYAPRTPLECAIEGVERAQQRVREGRRVGLVTLGKPADILDLPGVTLVALPENPADFAAGLFAALHTLDDLQLDQIVVTWPPDTNDWLGVRDRLRRAIH